MERKYRAITDAALSLTVVEKTNSTPKREAEIRKMENILLSAIELGHDDKTIMILVEMIRAANQFRF